MTLTLTFLEVIARVVVHRRAAVPHTTRGSIIRFDPKLGWVKPPLAEAWLHRPEYHVHLEINSRGLRGPDRDYAKPSGTRRILLLGDSFTEGLTVREQDTVRAALEKAVQTPGCGPWEVINGGTMGYGTDQEYLFFLEEGRRYEPDIVVLLFFYNDLNGNLTADRKPYFTVEEGRLVLHGSPVPTPSGGEWTRQPEPRQMRIDPWHGSMALRLLGDRTEQGNPRLHRVLARTGLVEPSRTQTLPADFWPFGPGHRDEVAEMWRRTEAILAALRTSVESSGGRFLVFYIPDETEIDPRVAEVPDGQTVVAVGPGLRAPAADLHRTRPRPRGPPPQLRGGEATRGAALLPGRRALERGGASHRCGDIGGGAARPGLGPLRAAVRMRSASHRAAATAMLFLGTGAILALTCWRVDLRAEEAIRALGILVGISAPAGYLVTRKVGPAVLTTLERVLLAGTVGYLLAAPLYYGMAWIGADPMFPVVVGAIAIAAALTARRDAGRRVPPPAEREVIGAGVGACLVAMALFILTKDNRAFRLVPDGLLYPHSIDHLINQAFYWEVLRGLPPEQLPTAAGIPFPRYHVLAYVPGAILMRWGGLGVTTIYHAITPLVHIGLILGCLYAAVRIRTGQRRLAAAAVVVLCFVSDPLERYFVNRLVWGTSPFYYVVRSVSGGGGTAVWAAVFLLLSIDQRSRQIAGRGDRTALCLAALLAGLSAALKAHAFLIFGGALIVALGILAVRERSRSTLLALAVLVGISGALALGWQQDDSLGRLALTPGAFAAQMMDPVLARDPSPAIRESLRAFLVRFPHGLGWVVAVPLGVWRLLGCSVLVPLFLVHVWRTRRRTGLVDLTVFLAIVITLGLAYSLSASDIHGERTVLIVREGAHTLQLLAPVIDVLVATALVARWRKGVERWVLGATVAVAAALLPLTLRPVATMNKDEDIVIGRHEECALLALREKTGPEAVVASIRPDDAARVNRHAVVAAFAGRRSVLEFYEKEVDGRWNREKDLRRLFATDDPAVAERLLRRHDVDFVIEYDRVPLHAARLLLAPMLVTPSVTLYQYGGGRHPPIPQTACPSIHLR